MMYVRLVICSHLLILLVTGSTVVKARDLHHDDIHSHMHPSVAIFFFLEDLKLRNTIPIYFPKRELSDALAHLLSKDDADSIPFSSRNLDHLLRRFAFARDSPQAKAMEDTLRECERQPIKGEVKLCATSSESLSDFTKTVFGAGAPINSLSTTFNMKRSGEALLQKYRVMGIREIPAQKLVSCHTMPYAYTVLFCHYQESENRVSLDGDNGDGVEGIAVCHMDTSQWGRNHVAFKMLGIEAGSSAVCHFFPADNFVVVPSTTPAAAQM